MSQRKAWINFAPWTLLLPNMLAKNVSNMTKWFKEMKNRWLHIYPTPPPHAGCNTSLIFLSGVQLVWIQSFPSSRPVAILKLMSSVYPTIYPLLEGGIVGFIPSPRVLALCEMQTWLGRRVNINIRYTLSACCVYICEKLFCICV